MSVASCLQARPGGDHDTATRRRDGGGGPRRRHRPGEHAPPGASVERRGGPGGADGAGGPSRDAGSCPVGVELLRLLPGKDAVPVGRPAEGAGVPWPDRKGPRRPRAGPTHPRRPRLLLGARHRQRRRDLRRLSPRAAGARATRRRHRPGRVAVRGPARRGRRGRRPGHRPADARLACCRPRRRGAWAADPPRATFTPAAAPVSWGRRAEPAPRRRPRRRGWRSRAPVPA